MEGEDHTSKHDLMCVFDRVIVVVGIGMSKLVDQWVMLYDIWYV